MRVLCFFAVGVSALSCVVSVAVACFFAGGVASECTCECTAAGRSQPCSNVTLDPVKLPDGKQLVCVSGASGWAIGTGTDGENFVTHIWSRDLACEVLDGTGITFTGRTNGGVVCSYPVPTLGSLEK